MLTYGSAVSKWVSRGDMVGQGHAGVDGWASGRCWCWYHYSQALRYLQAGRSHSTSEASDTSYFDVSQGLAL